MVSPLVRQVVAIDAREDDVAQTPVGDGLGHLLGLVDVEWGGRAAGLDGAEAAVSCVSWASYTRFVKRRRQSMGMPRQERVRIEEGRARLPLLRDRVPEIDGCNQRKGQLLYKWPLVEV